MLNNLHIFKIKYLSATNIRGSRVKITSERFQHSKIIAYDYQFNSITEMAENYLKAQGHKLIGKGEGKENDYIIARTYKNEFKTLI